MMNGRFGPLYDKVLEKVASIGLLGVPDSMSYSLAEVVNHHHSRTIWCGKSANQAVGDGETDWAADTLTPFQAISGAGVYGADADDEAKLVGTGDVMGEAGSVYYDLHEMLVVGVSEDSVYKIRVITGSGNMADAITAKTYSEGMVKFDKTNPQQSAGIPFVIVTKRATVGTEKMWVQARNAVDNATIDFFVGGHGYRG